MPRPSPRTLLVALAGCAAVAIALVASVIMRRQLPLETICAQAESHARWRALEHSGPLGGRYVVTFAGKPTGRAGTGALLASQKLERSRSVWSAAACGGEASALAWHASVLHNYDHVVNGFAAELSDGAVAGLRSEGALVEPDVPLHASTLQISATP